MQHNLAIQTDISYSSYNVGFQRIPSSCFHTSDLFWKAGLSLRRDQP